MEAKGLYIILAFLPLLSLILLSLIKSIRWAAFGTFLLTTALYFYWEAPLHYFLASQVAALVSTINILLIVFGAVFLFEVMNDAGYINGIKKSMQEIHPSRSVQFFLITIGLTGFFEGISGFGTPGAIIPLLLISLGFQPLFSVASVLFMDGLFAAFGAVGTPLSAGLQITLNLSETEAGLIAKYAAVLLAVGGLLFFLVIYRMYQQQVGEITEKGKVLAIYGLTFGFYVLVAWFFPEFPAIFSPVLMLFIMVLYISKGKPAISVKPWLPYMGLIILLLLPKIIPTLNQLLNLEIRFDNIFSSAVSAAIKPLRSPFVPFVLIGGIIMLFKQKGKQALNIAVSKVAAVFFILFPILAVSQMMITSGVNQPSMIAAIAQSFSYTGDFYILLAPFVGILGAFITGSTTVSNIVFGVPQAQTAALLGFEPALILALQLAGASLGNAVCLFNIVAAAVVAGIQDINGILKKVILPVLLAGILLGLLALVYLQF